MATRMQQRRGTAAQWISTDSGSGPILAAGEIGYESDTNKFKIGDGVNHWLTLDYFMDADSTVNPQFGSSIKFEGATANDFETTLQVTDPTADRTVTFQDATGTVVLRDSTDTLTNKSISLGSNTVTSTLAQLNTAVTDADVASLAGTETLTNKTLTSPVISSISNTGTLTLPTSTGTLALTTDISTAISNASAAQDSDDIVEGVLNLYYTSARSDLKANLANPTFTGTVNAAALTLSGDLTVNGTTTTINSTTLAVDDKNIVLGDVATPSDVTADGGGITLKGATDKTFNWVDATDSWTSSEHVNLASGKSYYVNGTLLKDVTETLTNKTLTSPALTTPTISTIDAAGDLLIGTADNTLGRIAIGTNGYVLTSNGTTATWAAAAASGADEILVLMGAY